jgi:hypothetical protein
VVVTPGLATIDFEVPPQPVWTWNAAEGGRDRTMEYAWLAEVDTPGQGYEIGFTHFRDLFAGPSSGTLQALLDAGSGYVWCRTTRGGGVAMRGVAVQTRATRRGIRAELHDSATVRLIFSQHPDSVDLVVTLDGLERSRRRVPVEYRRYPPGSAPEGA